jgi:hypothetical protein
MPDGWFVGVRELGADWRVARPQACRACWLDAPGTCAAERTRLAAAVMRLQRQRTPVEAAEFARERMPRPRT